MRGPVATAFLVAAIAALVGFAPAGARAGEYGFDYQTFHSNRGWENPAAPAPGNLARTTPDDADRAETSRSGNVLLIEGVIGPGAHRQFQAAVARTRPSLVVLDGPGGILGEALLIAEEVRQRGLSTLVSANRSCASACAIVFLAGRTKYMGAGAAVGLHAASFADGRADPEATALMAGYLRQLGVPRSTLARMAETAPSDIRWLNSAEKNAVGIRAYGGG